VNGELRWGDHDDDDGDDDDDDEEDGGDGDDDYFPNQHMMYIELRVCLIIGFYTRFNIAMKYYQGK
jgi:hypothetical protein